MKKGQVSIILRMIGLMHLIDWIRYYLKRYENFKINNAFRQDNPTVKLPPDYLMYESFQINYKKYYTESIETAEWLTGYLKKHLTLHNKKILDWGCGPGRVIRHMPTVCGNDCEYFGTDYNKKSIEWCMDNLPGIAFNNNTLEAKLPYESEFFDIIYGLSIFTHLSEPMHYAWYKELRRVLKPGGVMFFTTHGDNFKGKLTSKELISYNAGKLIIRGNVKEGHRTYSAYQPAEFMKNLFKDDVILEHIEEKPEKGKWPPQSIWIVKKT